MSTENTQTNTSDTAAPATTHTTAAPAAKKRVRRPAKKAATKPVVKKTPATVKPSVKATSKVASKPANKAASKAKTIAKPESKAIVVESHKLKKPKLVRDSFTFPKDEYQAIAALKQKALGLKHNTKKSEILRAGLKLLSSLNDKAFLTALSNVPALKTGRPAKS
jgi:hypothetical protein